MKTTRLFPTHPAVLLAILVTLAMPRLADAQVTNWVAYNDHRPSTAPVANGWAITAVRATGHNMGAPADTTGTLTDFLTGNPLAATVTFSRTGAPDDFGTVTRPLPTNTPAGQIFYGKCDLSNDGIVGVDALDVDIVTITFSSLDPAKRYLFRGTGGRNGGYAPRWTVATITNVSGYIDAHLDGAGPGVITSVDFPANFGPGQAAWNSGHNAQGAVIGWDDIAPMPDGTFQIVCQQYVGPTPGGGQATDANYGYSFGAMLLAEVESVAPTITSHPPAMTSVEQNRPISLSVAATGTPLLYQWYKEGVGAIAGATFATYAIPQAALANSGSFYAVVYNSLARATSSVAQVTVFADTFGPSVTAIFSYPTVDAGGVATLDQIIVEFNETVEPFSVSDTANYLVSGGIGNPLSVILSNAQTVVLVLATPLAENTDYSVQISGAMDILGNVTGSASPTFHSWVTDIGNGLIMESYDAGTGVEVDTLTGSPNYPDNPFRRDVLRAFESRLVFADNAREQYGARIRGVFIPPVSGNWVFFLRTFDRGVVYLNPNGTDAAGAIEILRESTGNNPRNWDKFTSSPFALRAGQGYYIEGLYKADAGTDVMKVAARLQGTGFPTPVDTVDTDVDANSLSGAFIAYPLAPRNFGGVLTITQDLLDTMVENNHDATFSVAVNNPSGLPLVYRWSRDGNPIAGANGPTYTFPATIAADNNAMFSVEVAKVGGHVTSRTARLTVVPDTTGPRILEVSSPNLTTMTVRFNERLEPTTAQDSVYFGLSGPQGNIGSILSVLEPDGRTVTVTPSVPLVAGESYQMSVCCVLDLGNIVIDPEPTIVNFKAGAFLTISRSGNQVVLSWPMEATGFTLEETDVLAIPSSATVWTPVATVPTVLNGRNTVTLSIGPGSKAYRLRQ